MEKRKTIIGLIGGSALASAFLIFIWHRDIGWALSCNASGVTKVDCDNLPSSPCSEHTSACSCGGNRHTVHNNQTGGPCGGEDRIEHTPETATDYTCEGCDHDFVTVSKIDEKYALTHLSDPPEDITTHIRHTSTGGHIEYVETLEEEENGADDAGLSARGEQIEDIDTGLDPDSWCVHINKCNTHRACSHCDSYWTTHSSHKHIECADDEKDCQETDSWSHRQSHTDYTPR